MAAVCSDSLLLNSVTFKQSDIFEAYPKVENHIGDTPYFLENSIMLVLASRADRPDSCIKLKAISVTMMLVFGVIVGLLGGPFMYYIPLYVALTPVLYWLLKIGYAYFSVKNKKLHTGSSCFSGKHNG